MELKEGMYVRTNYRKEKVIRKIVKIVEDPLSHDHYLIFDKPTRYKYYVEDNNFIAKKDAIDLIELGDYVNNLVVTRICVDEETEKKYLNLYGSLSEWENEDIESIVTKEMFNFVKYEVER